MGNGQPRMIGPCRLVWGWQEGARVQGEAPSKHLPQGYIVLGSSCECHWPLVSQLKGWDLAGVVLGVSSGEPENPRVGVLGLTMGQPWKSVFGEAVGESEHKGQPRVLVGSSQDGPADWSFSGIIPGAEEWGPEVHWETMWEDFWGSCRARGRAESRGHHPWGGWGGLRAWCPLGVQMGVGVQHLGDVQDVRVSEKMG